jgi:hypothetical protein
VVGEFGQFLDADAGCSQDLHGGPGPEREVFFHAQVASVASVRVIDPDLVGGTGEDRAGQGLPVDGEPIPRAGLAGGGQQRRGGLAPLVDGAHQHRKHGQPFAGAGIHARLPAPGGLALVDLLLADRAGSHPSAPAGGVLDRPLGQIQVEGPDWCQALAIADPFNGDDLLVARTGDERFGSGAQPLLPRCGDLG